VVRSWDPIVNRNLVAPTSHSLSSAMSYQDRPYTSNPSSSRPVSYGQPYSDRQDPHAPIRPLYHESKDDLDQPFDVRADFDGDGPRWSDVYGTGPKLSDQVRDERK
jgi:hypothetical protein